MFAKSLTHSRQVPSYHVMTDCPSCWDDIPSHHVWSSLFKVVHSKLLVLFLTLALVTVEKQPLKKQAQSLFR